MLNTIKKFMQSNKSITFVLAAVFVLFAGVGLISNVASAAAQDEFVFTIKTDNPGTTNSTSFKIETYPYGSVGSSYNYDIDWGDGFGFSQLAVTGDATHDYGVADEYTIRIRGDFPAMSRSAIGLTEAQKLISIGQWGSQEWGTFENAFTGATNLQILASDTPDLGDVTNMSRVFSDTTFASGIENWNVSNVQDMQYAFSGSSYNNDLSNWNVSSLIDMKGIFNMSNFNGDISDWNVANVENMSKAFSYSSFNGDISNWDVKKVEDMGTMFRNTNFNGDISAWEPISLETAHNMFYSNTSFSQENYDALLNGWSQHSLEHAVTLSAPQATYCNGTSSRNAIIATYAWVFDGDTQLTGCVEATTPTADSIISGIQNPVITGTYDNVNTSNIVVTINGKAYTSGAGEVATNGQNWSVDLAAQGDTLPYGTYEVSVNTEGALDYDTNEVEIIAIAAPTVSQNSTVNTSPVISGMWDSANATSVQVVIDGTSYYSDAMTVVISGNTWEVDLAAYGQTLLVNTQYDVQVTTNGVIDTDTGEIFVGVMEIPTINEISTLDTQPIITGTWDSIYATEIIVTIDGVPYTLSSGQITYVGNDWELNLSALFVTLNAGAYDATVETDGVFDITTDDITIESAVVAPTQQSRRRGGQRKKMLKPEFRKGYVAPTPAEKCFYSEVVFGEISPEVTKIQGFLNSILPVNLELDGVFGKKTQSAVKWFQGKYYEKIVAQWSRGDVPDGQWGTYTRSVANEMMGCAVDSA